MYTISVSQECIVYGKQSFKDNPDLKDSRYKYVHMLLFLKNSITPISLVNANSFHANFTSVTFQKIPIPLLTQTKKQKFLL